MPTKSQRIIEEEEAPVSSEPIRKAEERVEELKQWIKLRRQDELRKDRSQEEI